MLEIEYLCEHITCRMACHTGKITIPEQKFKDLSDVLDSNTFRSPSKVCKIGFTQTFRILAKKEIVSNAEISTEILVNNESTLEERIKTLETQVKELLARKN